MKLLKITLAALAVMASLHANATNKRPGDHAATGAQLQEATSDVAVRSAVDASNRGMAVFLDWAAKVYGSSKEAQVGFLTDGTAQLGFQAGYFFKGDGTVCKIAVLSPDYRDNNRLAGTYSGGYSCADEIGFSYSFKCNSQTCQATKEYKRPNHQT